MESTLVNVSNELAGIVDSVSPYVVSVRARRHYPSSGLLWSPEVVITADHTVQRDEEITVILPDGQAVDATLAGRDAGTDLAVLKLAAGAAAKSELRHASGVKAGELAMVLGRSPDSGANASLGIVSAVSGGWRTWRGGKLDAYIRLDAKLFPQSSGGAVVNARGELIGIATTALSRIAGVAIPVATVARVAEKLLEKGFMPRGYLGIGVQPVAFPDELRRQLSVASKGGLILLTVEPDGPAGKAGLLIGDILIAVEGTALEGIGDLQMYSESPNIGKPVKVQLVRGGGLKEATITVGERPGRR